MDAELVGRQRQLSDVATALADAAGGRPRVVSIEGDGGAGKTALARRSLDDLAVEHRTVVLAGDELTAAVPFATLGPLVDVPLETTVVEAARLVIGRLAELADAGLLVVLVDDLHWADPSSLEAFNFCQAALAGHALLAVATFRNDEVGPGSPLWYPIEEGAAQYVELRPFREAEIDALVRAMLHDVHMTDAFKAFLYDATAGNAFFLTELLRYLIEEEILTQREGRCEWVACETLCEALTWCWRRSRPGDALVLSPGCASYDQFRDYRHRAATFVEAARALVARYDR